MTRTARFEIDLYRSVLSFECVFYVCCTFSQEEAVWLILVFRAGGARPMCPAQVSCGGAGQGKAGRSTTYTIYIHNVVRGMWCAGTSVMHAVCVYNLLFVTLILTHTHRHISTHTYTHHSQGIRLKHYARIIYVTTTTTRELQQQIKS